LTDSREVLLVAINYPAGREARELIGLFSGIVIIDELQIDNLAVAEDWRRRGLASNLLCTGAHIAAGRGASTLVLELRSKNLPALSLYIGQGLIITGRRPDYYRDPLDDALIMSAPIERIITNWRAQN
jgi:ribosomal protein S18 acetylase RimI-like enzyme